MSKNLMWCVFDEKGRPMRGTLAITKAASMQRLWMWEEHKNNGFTCRKVEVTIKEVKL